MPRPISATISLSSLSHNLGVVFTQLSTISAQNSRLRPKVWAVIKANAYGHGIANAVRAFSQADGLAMLDLDEAVRCRDAGWTKPILLLEGFFEPADITVADQYRLTTTLHCQEQIDMLMSASPSRSIDALVKLNTGMNRLGFAPAEFRAAYRQAQVMQQKGVLGTLGKMTHFARCDDDAVVTDQQVRVFKETVQGLDGRVSVCNSAATLQPARWLSMPAGEEQWVRPGICLYGASPFGDQTAHSFDLLPAMTLASKLISVRTIAAGCGVGYGHTFVAPTAMRIGVVACGYADGYPRHAPNGTPVYVDGVRTQLLGRVSMDMLTVDLTNVPGAQPGTSVVLWGQGGPSVDEVAQAAHTIGYELLCALAQRVSTTII
ncbi:MAG TPA: alanine racemase [Eoetvoesiella sp.]